MAKQPQYELYRDGDLVLGFCGTAGLDGVYRYRLCRQPILRLIRKLLRQDQWKFCPPGTKAWDFYHQKVYRQHRAERCSPADLGGLVPPLPIEFPPPRAPNVLDPPPPRSRDVLPGSRVYEAVRAFRDARLPVYVVLREDLYESVSGDGVFHDFEAAFLERAEAQSFVATQSDDATEEDENSDLRLGIAYHIREVYLTVSAGEVVVNSADSQLSPFDRFTREEICNELAKHLE